MIRFDQVVKRYPGGQEALRQVSLKVNKGEMVLLTGHSGAGKTTLLRLAAAIERPTAGTITVGGQNLSRLGNRGIPYLRRNFGLVFQDHKLLYDRSVFENVVLPLRVTGFGAREAGSRVRAALDKVGLLAREQSNPVELSGGEQQRVCIARAIVHRPAILLADEPTGNLDPENARNIVALFEVFQQVGATILVATHDADAFRGSAPRVITLSAGAVLS